MEIKEHPESHDQPEVGIFVSGGNIQWVRTNVPTTVRIFDEDNYAEEEDRVRAQMLRELALIKRMPYLY